MKRPSPSLFILAGATLLFLACSGDGAQKPPHPPAAVPNATILPGDTHRVSELAQLMRDMVVFADSTKHRLERGDALLPKPGSFATMLTAASTPGMVDHRIFDPFAMAYLKQLDSLYSTTPAHRQEAFDELIQYCAACHGSVCPGPLTRINKLHLATGKH